MITPSLIESAKTPLYEQLYRSIRSSIQDGSIAANEKLPSKRKLAAHLNISQCTVENAYTQLIAEGYLTSIEKRGYYACALETMAVGVAGQGDGMSIPVIPPHEIRDFVGTPEASVAKQSSKQQSGLPRSLSFLAMTGIEHGDGSCSTHYDLKTNTIDTSHFPYSVWSRLMRECIRNEPDNLISPIHPQGDLGLRQQIARHLHDYRGMQVQAEQIVIGAGTEYLLGLISELLPHHCFAIEDPGHHKFSQLFKSRNIPFCPIPVDREGLTSKDLYQSEASVVLITPSHQFPLSVIMSISRRQQLLKWAATRRQRFIIEDDFNSGFNFGLRPVPALYNLDNNQRVIYLNSFANTLAPSLRIAYMVLPPELLERYQQSLMFYSCTVSKFEQLTLKLFLQEGYFERHLSRMRKIYKKRQAALVDGLSPLQNSLTLDGQKSGLHLLATAKHQSEAELVSRAQKQGVRVYPLSDYYYNDSDRPATVVLGFAGYPTDQLQQAARLLVSAWQ